MPDEKVTILLRAVGDAPILKQKKFSVDASRTVAWFTQVIKKMIALADDQTLHMYISQTFAPSPDHSLGSLRDCYAVRSDGYLLRKKRVSSQVPCKMNAGERMTNLLALARPQKISNTIPIVRYYRSMIECYRMAVSHANNQDLETALVLLIRFCSFTLEELPKHIQFGQFDGEEKRAVLSLLKPAIERAEDLKKTLRAKFENEAKEICKSYAPQIHSSNEDGHASDKSNIPVPYSDVGTVSIVDPQINTSNIFFPGFDVISNSKDCGGQSTTNAGMRLDRSNKPDSPPVCNIIGNRLVLIAGDLIEKFLICAEDNTMRNIETCGTLCGCVIGCEFLVSHVILPRQKGASDGCFAEGEEEVFAYQNKHDLITLGWIHTHPSQTAFLSSVDLHTQFAYQMMLNEAIAIVCAPSYNQVGTFVLSSYGMSVVECCTKSGFHLHPDAEKLFLEAKHVKYSNSHDITVVDMRK
ncbi:Mov34/MPN/PAD-1 family protein [Dictyocaulus viviparus]|uniref:Mov34/MPN/PAD-1 family protein n=1 Tax=Dictyocaulus viviparus TaxID=29172 RepID=A0A0D8YDZ4_DICVI|nr:Mov34/MPN/PAD-1 family protein [Dictyocaulus viviparus]